MLPSLFYHLLSIFLKSRCFFLRKNVFRKELTANYACTGFRNENQVVTFEGKLFTQDPTVQVCSGSTTLVLLGDFLQVGVIAVTVYAVELLRIIARFICL